ncbi:OmpA family protein [Shewanella sp.]|nr:OmpA family protein [Shewanella sp.]
MKTLITLLSFVLLSGCATKEIVSMDTPTPQQFDLNDHDHDGVINARERCAETEQGASIDNYGCGKMKSIDIRQKLELLFTNDSYYIDPASYPQVEMIANIMKKNPKMQVVIEGHSSKTGSDEHNKTLSKNRANAVSTLLSERFNIAPSRLSAVGYGFDRPVDPSHSAQAHQANRRVIAQLTGSDMAADLRWHIYTVDSVVK